jgi:hypothetical protein
VELCRRNYTHKVHNSRSRFLDADESEFWLEFIMEEKMIKKEMVFPLFNEAHELSDQPATSKE